jgi:phosphate-selective porin OprO/OprP
MQTDFGKGNVTLKDYYFDAEFAKHTWLRVGQWKRPFSRQQITSSGRLELTDRSITDKAFLGSRDIGLAVHNNYEKSPDFEWIVGVFNGTGDTSKLKPTVDPVTGAVTGGSFSNIPAKLRPVWVARAGINHNGIKGYSEADLEGGPVRFAAAANIAIEGDNDDDDTSQQRAGVDYIVKAEGFSTTGGFYLMSEQDGLSLTDQELSFLGFHVQAGYMVTPKIQAAARYALVDARPDEADDQQEITIGGNYYAFGHDAKLAAAVRFIKIGDEGFDDGILVEIGANVGF